MNYHGMKSMASKKVENMEKEKRICGAVEVAHITEEDGKKIDLKLMCDKKPKHWGKHRMMFEWKKDNSRPNTKAGVSLG
jgi:hypothetical protein